MSLSVSQNKDLYKAALNQFVSEAQFYAGQAQDYLVNLSMGERLLGLCAFIMLVMYIIVSRARRKYNPGSHGRQFVAAVILVSIVAFGTGWTFDSGEGSMSGLFMR